MVILYCRYFIGLIIMEKGGRISILQIYYLLHVDVQHRNLYIAFLVSQDLPGRFLNFKN